MFPSFHHRGAAVISTVLAIWVCPAASSAESVPIQVGSIEIEVWDGGSPDDSNWKTDANWLDDSSPHQGATLQITFDGTVRTAPDLDKQFKLNVLKFEAGAASFTLDSSSGKGLRFEGVLPAIIGASASDQAILHSVELDSDTIIQLSGGTLTIQGSISGAGGLDKRGTAPLIVRGENTFTGLVTLREGTLFLGAGERIADTAGLVLAGGTLATAGFSETLGALTLLSDSTIDLGEGESLLHFTESASSAWTEGSLLTVVNWNGFPSGLGSDRVSFGSSSSSLTEAQVGQIRFLNPAGYSSGTYRAALLGTGELVPIPIPEAPSILFCGLLVSAALWRERSHFRKLRDRWRP